MILYIKNHPYLYECENLCRVFFPDEAIKAVTEGEASDDIVAYTELWQEGDKTHVLARVTAFGVTHEICDELESSADGFDEICERKLATALYNAFRAVTGYTPQWGLLTGVRPAKLMHALSAKLGSDDKASDFFKNELLVSPHKTALARRVAQSENAIIALSQQRSFSLYISIPFCPTRCSYCSFVSSSMKSAKKLIPEYVELLKREIIETAKIASSLNLRLESIYFGGGTPTTLEAHQLKELIETIEQNFDLSFLREYTIEAGRPDTLTREKLEVIGEGFNKRISINPQTMNDDVLKVIGRAHSAQQATDMFALAREVGLSNINMDIIAGLPTDTLESFLNTVDEIIALSPESITVHTLSLKRSSTLAAQDRSFLKDSELVSDMLNKAQEKLYMSGYFPYYMYRQSRMVGNLENVGWSKAGYECLYNVFMMDETHTILSCGAGAVTKLRVPGVNKIERIFNYKYPFEYVSGFDTILERKGRIAEFYSEFDI
ncbi:MAG: coproporphyrinogen dehydrogenase HemZ [Clostridia bacterium]|nr:coproporphyrinogen dehydrogenase HemZ [Clostridia bacterium]